MTAVLPDPNVRQETKPMPGNRLGRSAPGLAAFSAGGPANRELYISLCQITDTTVALASLTVAFVLTNLGRMPSGLQNFLAERITLEKLLLVGLFVVVWRITFGISRLYEWRRIRLRSQELSGLIAASTVGSSFTLAFVLQSASGAFNAGVVLYFWMAATGLVVLLRSVLRMLTFSAPASGTQDVIIVGSGPRALSVYRQLSADRQGGYNVLGFVDSTEAVASEEIGHRLLGRLDQLESILMRQALDEVVIALPMRSRYNAIDSAIQVCARVGVRAKYLADVFPDSIARLRFEDSRELPAVAIAIAPEDGRLLVKRLIDILGSIIGLAVFAPVMAVTTLAIKLTSAGPVIFAQERFGLNKRRFRMYKFRTMTADAEVRQAAVEHLNEARGPVFKIRNDPRLTRIGGFLRKSSIDELPQLLNVLRGEMSLVGPRPMAVRDVGRFTEAAPMRRFSVLPGLTCLWQVSGRSELGFEDWMRLDLQYINQWSLTLDFLILARTVPAVLRGVGAT
jgi:exopolysaccharide biosynthesis polyprenyl glycosylphosphotransferase